MLGSRITGVWNFQINMVLELLTGSCFCPKGDTLMNNRIGERYEDLAGRNHFVQGFGV